jgi:hypothetical protein
MLTILFSIIVTLIVAGLIYWLISLIPLPPPFPEIIRVVVILAVVLYLLSIVFGWKGVIIN